jgi:hypothetical protein
MSDPCDLNPLLLKPCYRKQLLKILGGLGSARDIIRTGVLYLSGVASGPRFRVGSSTASTGEVERTT